MTSVPWRSVLLAVIALWLLAGTLLGQDDAVAELARDAVAAYEGGDFEVAAEFLEAAIEAGAMDPALYFNLGNAYYEMGQLGPAMLNYRRAVRWAPRDADVRANLALMRALRVDFQGDEVNIIDRLATLGASTMRRSEQVAITLAVWSGWFGLAAGWVVGWLPRRREMTIGLAGSAVIVLVAVLALAARLHADAERPSAVVLRNVVAVYSGPGGDYLEIYRLHAAAEMRLLETQGSWARFVLPDGRQGWIGLDAIERVDGR
jgi:tetratricopeptide (TPR) repeat protein